MSINRKYVKHKQVYQVVYSYKDMELGELITQTEYLPTIHSLVDYMKDMEEEHHIVDTVHFRCREDIVIKIKQVYITEKQWLSLFNDLK